jgi:hypothetical protein
MANKDAAFGLRPIGKVGQNADNQGLSEYLIADAYATSIFQGDLVTAVNGGTVEVIDDATTTNILGVFWGTFITKDPTSGKPRFANYYSSTDVASGEEIRAFVYDDPFARFEIQADGTANGQGDVFANANIVYGSPSTINGVSKTELATATIASATAVQLRIMGVSKDIENSDIASANVNFVVNIPGHLYRSSSQVNS